MDQRRFDEDERGDEVNRTMVFEVHGTSGNQVLVTMFPREDGMIAVEVATRPEAGATWGPPLRASLVDGKKPEQDEWMAEVAAPVFEGDGS